MPEQKLKQRPVGKNAEGKEPQNVKNLVELQPDFVFKVLYVVEKKTFKPSIESENNLKLLVKILDLHDFIIEIRPDSNSNYLLVFVKLREESFEKLVEVSNRADALFNVPSNATTDDKITTSERLRLIYKKLTLEKNQGGCGIDTGNGLICDILPVRNIDAIEKEYKNNWSKLGKLFKNNVRKEQAAFLIQNYGTKYSFYHKFVQVYVSSIGCLGLIGLFCWYFLGNFSQIYALFNLLTGLTLYLCIYAGEKVWSKEWRVQNVSKTEVSRTESRDASYKVLFRKVLFIPILVSGAMTLFSGQFICFIIEIFVTELYEGPLKSIFSLVPTILVCAFVPIGTTIYSFIVKKYLLFENNPTVESENSSFLIKLFIFNFLSVYSPLLITSFIYFPLGYMLDPYLATIQALVTNMQSVSSFIPNIPIKNSSYSVNQARLSGQIFYFMVTNQIIGLILEFALPQILSIVLSYPRISKLLGTPESEEIEINDDSIEEPLLQSVRADFIKPVYNIDDDYRQQVLQYGFLMLFGPIWPLGSLISFFIGIIQQEGDYIKLLHFVKPPVPDRVESSYPWPIFMKILLIIGSFTSIAINLMYGSDIIAVVGNTSVKNSWYFVLPISLLGCLLMQLLLWCFESIIDEAYSDDEKELATKEHKFQEMLISLRKDESAGNDISEIIDYVDKLPEILKKKK